MPRSIGGKGPVTSANFSIQACKQMRLYMLIQKHVRSSCPSEANFKSACRSAVCATKLPYCIDRFTARQCSALLSDSRRKPSTGPSGQNNAVLRLLGQVGALNEMERRSDRSISIDGDEGGDCEVRTTVDCGEGGKEGKAVLITTRSVSKRLTESFSA